MQFVKRAVTTFFAASLCAAAACGSDSPAAPTLASVAGTWNLQTVNGVSLPLVLSQTSTEKHELTALTFDATSTGTFTETDSYRDTVNGVVSTSSTGDSGTYTINGSSITFTFDSDGLSDTGTISGNTLTIISQGIVLVLRKQ